MVTAGGAKVLGRDDIGVLAPGKAADKIGRELLTKALLRISGLKADIE